MSLSDNLLSQQVIYRAMVDTDFAMNTYKDLTFSEDNFGEYKDIAIGVRRHYTRYETPVSAQALTNELATRLDRSHKLTEETRHELTDQIGDITSIGKEANYSNDSEIYDQVLQWCRQVMVVQALTNTLGNDSKYKLGDAKAINNLLDNLNKAQMVGVTSETEEHISLIDADTSDDLVKVLTNVRRDTVPTSLHDLDKLTGGGLGKGEVGLVVAKSGSGKTTTLVNLAEDYTMHAKCHVLYIALEERISRMALRVYRLIVQQSMKDIYDDKGKLRAESVKHYWQELKKLYDAGRIGNMDIVKSNPQTVTPAMVESYIQQYIMQHQHTPDVVFVDYPDLMLNPHAESAGEWRGMGLLFEDLRRIAGKYKLILWTASQANRGASQADVVDASQFIEGSKQKLNTVELALSVNQNEAEFKAGFIRFHVDKVRNPDDTYDKMLYFKVNTKTVAIANETPEDREAHEQVLEEFTSSQDTFGKFKRPGTVNKEKALQERMKANQALSSETVNAVF